jgi:hypothetical protein
MTLEVVAVAARTQFTLLVSFHFPLSSQRPSYRETRWRLSTLEVVAVAARTRIKLLVSFHFPLSLQRPSNRETRWRF